MNQLVSTNEGGIIASGNMPNLHDTTDSLAVRLAQVEIDSAVSTAKKFPRSLPIVKQNILELVMLDAQTAEECVYALPRGGKPIKGPSIRFAEIVVNQYGNCHVGSRVVDTNRVEKYVEAEGVFKDLQTGMARTARVRRRIVDKNGRLFNDDMIIVTQNAACSIALREAILKGIPKALWREAYDAAEHVISGDVKTLAQRRTDAFKALAAFGVTPDQVFASLEVDGIDDIGLDELATMFAIYKGIKSGEQNVEDFFPAKANSQAGIDAARGTAAKLGAIAGQAQAQPKAQDKPTDQAAPKPAQDAAEQGDQGQPQAKAAESDKAPETDASAGSDEDEEPEVTDEQAQAAYQAGRDARKAGRKASACPQSMRAASRLFSSWNDGWADENEAMNPATE